MNKGERKVICLLLIGISICCGILIFKINTKPEYNQELYNEIYTEYEDILSTLEDNKNIENEMVKTNEDDTSHVLVNSQGKAYRVAGAISIPKIRVNYPIIYETSDEYLKIAPTKLFGPEINQIGNVCIVGHNYENEKFFGRLCELEKNDKVYLLDNRAQKLEYIVYDKYEVDETDLSCTNQATNGKVEVTLITCTNTDNKRLVIKCKVV